MKSIAAAEDFRTIPAFGASVHLDGAFTTHLPVLR
jgi:hypothetical protein